MSKYEPRLVPLTVKQQAALAAIHDHWKRHGKPPTVAQVAIKLGLGRTGAHQLMVECRDRGYATGPITQGNWGLTEAGRALLEGAPKKRTRRA